jgi:hypothetical protein
MRAVVGWPAISVRAALDLADLRGSVIMVTSQTSIDVEI